MWVPENHGINTHHKRLQKVIKTEILKEFKNNFHVLDIQMVFVCAKIHVKNMDNFIIIILKLQVGCSWWKKFPHTEVWETTLVYTWFSLNCMLTQTACLVACQTYLVLLLSPLKQRMCSSSSYTKGKAWPTAVTQDREPRGELRMGKAEMSILCFGYTGSQIVKMHI